MNIPLMSAVCANDKAVLIKHSYISLWLVSHCSSLSYAVSHCYVGEGGLLRSCNNFVLSEYWFVISANERNKKSSSFLIISSLSIYVSSPSKTTMLISIFPLRWQQEKRVMRWLLTLSTLFSPAGLPGLSVGWWLLCGVDMSWKVHLHCLLTFLVKKTIIELCKTQKITN